MIFHPPPFLRGDTARAAQYVPQALALLRQCQALPLVSEVRELAPGVQLTIHRIGQWARLYISAEGGVGSYEFYGALEFYTRPKVVSKARVDAVGGFDGITSGQSDILGRLVRTEWKGQSARIISAALSDGSVVGGYPAIDYAIEEIKPVHTWTPKGWNGQRAPEYVWWQRNDPSIRLTSTMGIQPANGTAVKGLNAYGVGRNIAAYYADTGFDLQAYSHFSKTDHHNDGLLPGLTNDDWWRRACLQTVVDATWGTRTFLIQTDVQGRFHAAPLSAFSALADNFDQFINVNEVIQTGFQSATPAWPAWVTLTGGFRPKPYMAWAFNSTGTRAVTTPIEELAPGEDGFNARVIHKVPTAADVPFTTATAFMDSVLFRVADIQSGHESLATTAKTVASDKPGLFEVSIDIALTGANPEDFTLTLNTVRALHDDGIYRLAADYAVDDKRLEALGVLEDDLIAAEVDCFAYSISGAIVAKPRLSTNPADTLYSIGWIAPSDSGDPADMGTFEADLLFRNLRTGQVVWRMPILRNAGRSFPNAVYDYSAFFTTWAGGFSGITTGNVNRTNRLTYLAFLYDINCRVLGVCGQANGFGDTIIEAIEWMGREYRNSFVQQLSGFLCAYGKVLKEEQHNSQPIPFPITAFKPFTLDYVYDFTPSGTRYRIDCRATGEVSHYNWVERSLMGFGIAQSAIRFAPNGSIAASTGYFSTDSLRRSTVDHNQYNDSPVPPFIMAGIDLIQGYDQKKGALFSTTHLALWNQAFGTHDTQEAHTDRYHIIDGLEARNEFGPLLYLYSNFGHWGYWV